MPLPTWRLGALVALLGVVALWSGEAAVPLLLLGNGALLIAAVVDAVRAQRPAAITVERALPTVVQLGDEAELRWRVTATAPRGAAVTHVAVADALPPSWRATRRRFRASVRPGVGAEEGARITPARRGRFDLGELAVRVEGPWRLAARQARRELSGTVRVSPRFDSRKEAELRLDRRRVVEVGLRSARGRGGGTEFEQLREYTVDDEHRRIDWSASARAGRLIVRTYRAERNQNVLVLVDHGRTMAGRIGGVPRLEHGMDAILALTTVATRLGDRVGMLAFADGVTAVLPPANRRSQVGAVAEVLADTHARLVEPDYTGAFAEALVRFRRRALIVLVTEVAESTVTDALLPALPLLARDHVLVVASVRDPDVARWASSPPAAPSSAYRAAAAVTALADRGRTIRLLRARGAVVVDAAPGRLAPDLVDAYLAVKATGRL